MTARLRKKITWSLLMIFLIMNIVAFFHAYKFTHFSDADVVKTKSPSKLSIGEKITTLVFGINNPRPQNKTLPNRKFTTIKLQSSKTIECWEMKTDSSKGIVILFHGYSGDKSTMLDKADVFLHLGYNTLVVDFIGTGGSEGKQTTIGFKESQDVKACYEYLIRKNEKNIILFGTSMGAAAIMKSIVDYKITPSAILLECPFGSMYQTTKARFKNMKVPAFPMAGLLVFWGGVQNGFWAFDHKPEKYAKSIACPVLLMFGEKDHEVSREEIDQIFLNITSYKELRLYSDAGHENYLIKYKDQWIKDVTGFLKSVK